MPGLHVRLTSFLAASLAVTSLPVTGVHLARAADKDPVVLGFVTGLSGERAEYGRRAVGIVTLFADTANAPGGIDGPLLGTVLFRFVDYYTRLWG